MVKNGIIFLNFSQLSKCKLFERVPPQDLMSAIKCLGGFTKSFQNEESVYAHGTEDIVPGLVLNGCILIHQIFADGSTVLLRSVGPGELFGVSMYFRPDENIYVTSSGNSKILFLHLPSKNGETRCNCKYRMIILENLIYILAENNCHMSQKIQILSRPSLREKLILFLSNQRNIQKSNELKLGMTREKIAQYINADRSAVSRELNRMQKDGLIVIKNKSVEIINLG